MEAILGLRYWVTRLIVLPLPAASLPSNTTTSLARSVLTHSCSFTSSACSRYSSAWYSDFFSRSAMAHLLCPTYPVSCTHPAHLARPSFKSRKHDIRPGTPQRYCSLLRPPATDSGGYAHVCH